jgi:hypothetical protein
MKDILSVRGRFDGALRWVAACAFAPLAAVAMSAELRCKTNYTLYKHVRGSKEVGACGEMTTIDGPKLDAIALDEKGGRGFANDGMTSVEADVSVRKVKMRIDDREEELTFFNTKLKYKPAAQTIATFSAEGYLRPNVGNLTSVGYLGEHDPAPKGPCTESRYLKVVCTVEPK